MQVQSNLNGQALPAAWPEKLKEGIGRLTDGFWEAVGRGLFGRRSFVGEQFLSVLLFFAFGGLCTLACLCQVQNGHHAVDFALCACVGGYRLYIGQKSFSSFGFSASVLFGVLLSQFFLPYGMSRFLFLCLFFGVRLMLGGSALNESTSVRVLFSAVFCSAYELYRWVYVTGTGDLWSVLSSFFLCALLTASFSGLSLHCNTRENTLEQRGGEWVLSVAALQREAYLMLSVCLFSFCVLSTLSSVRLFGFSPALLIAGILTMLTAARRGALYGALCGAIVGFAASSFEGAAALFCSGLLYGLFCPLSTVVAAAASFIAGGGFLWLFASAYAFASLAAELVLSHLFWFPLRKLLCTDLCAPTQSEGKRRREHLSLLQKKLTQLSGAFSSLSEVFYMATDLTMTPDGRQAADLVREAGERVCVRCSRSSDCWQQNYGLTQGALKHLSQVLLDKHEVEESDLEEYFRTRCKKTTALCREINRLYRYKNAGGSPEETTTALLCGKYASVARLLKTLSDEVGEERQINEEATRILEDCLNRLGIAHRMAYVTGGRRSTLRVTGVRLSKLALSTDELVRELEGALSMSFESPQFLPPMEDAQLILKRRRVVELSCARLVSAKGMQAVSGDTSGFFESEGEYFYSLICDGMGSGSEAAFTSRLSCIFLEKLLSFSHEKGVSLEMLNRFLLSQTEERFSTVDLLEVDFFTGQANFLKAGAAASYIRRGTGLYRIAAQTPPAGILNTPCAKETSVKLSGGDHVVMFSDGVVPTPESDAWFAQTLAFAPQADAKELAAYLMEEARRHNRDHADDMSISVLQVSAA